MENKKVGGKRIGSGRKTRNFGEKTAIMTCIYPKTMKKELRKYIDEKLKTWEVSRDKQK